VHLTLELFKRDLKNAIVSIVFAFRLPWDPKVVPRISRGGLLGTFGWLCGSFARPSGVPLDLLCLLLVSFGLP